jgi:hypothetical protein
LWRIPWGIDDEKKSDESCGAAARKEQTIRNSVGILEKSLLPLGVQELKLTADLFWSVGGGGGGCAAARLDFSTLFTFCAF